MRRRETALDSSGGGSRNESLYGAGEIRGGSKAVLERLRFEKTEEEKVTTYATEFWEFKCVQNLSKLTSEYATYFLENYDVKPEALTAALQTIQKATNSKLYTYLRKCLDGCRATMEAVN